MIRKLKIYFSQEMDAVEADHKSILDLLERTREIMDTFSAVTNFQQKNSMIAQPNSSLWSLFAVEFS